MTVTYGFYNSVAEDRKYDAIQMSMIFDGIIEDGVYATIGDYLLVESSTGMIVNVGTGRAWFDHSWTYNDALYPITLDTADPLLPRIDIIAIEINAETGVRANSFKKITGTPATVPVPPALTNTSTIHQYPLAYIDVDAGVTTIIQDYITNKIGTTLCPFVTGPLSFITTNELLAQWEAQFITWFNFMKDQLSEDAAGQLQLQINAIVGDLNPPLTSILNLAAHDHVGTNDGAQIPTAGLANDAVDDTKVGNRVPQFYRRQGGSATSWATQGVTNYTPTSVRMFGGSVTLAGSGTLSVTFPIPFSNAPLVFLQNVGDNPMQGVHVKLAGYSASGFTMLNDSTLAAVVFWFAVGPE